MERELLELDGRVAVVTGGASGIGKAIASLFAARGAQVHILDLDSSGAEATALKINQKGGSASGRRCDVSDAANVNSVFQEINHVAPIDILINNAGTSHIGNLEATTAEEFERILAINVKSTFYCMKAAMTCSMKERGGVILNMASIAGSVPLADRFAYGMSKAAVIAMTLSVAKDYVKSKIRCNSISPARVHTPFVDGYLKKHYQGREEEIFRSLSEAQPIGRMASPDEVASLALFLCSDQASFITGVDYPLDGGFSNLRG